MTDPLVVEFEIRAAPAEAFAIWTERIGTWWPNGHTLSGDPEAIAFEPRAGGRIYERAPDGTEHEWGEVIEWDPPRRLRCWWHLFFTRDEATELEISFAPILGGTRVTIRQSGWKRLGDAGPPRRERTRSVWTEMAELVRSHLR